jgi:long-chain acyl-CoA synthetase
MTVLEAIRANARAHPDHPALIVDGTPSIRVDYATLLACVDTHARTLGSYGVGAGTRCGLIARPGRGFIEAALAILASGGCMVPIADDSSPVVREQSTRDAFLHHLVVVDHEGLTCRALPAARQLAPGVETAFRAVRPAYLRFTSGTTACHKGVVLGHAAILARLAHANAGLGMTPADRVLWLLPMAHHFVVSILLYLRYGATILLPANTLARSMLAFARREHATVLYASPYHYAALSKDAGAAGLDDVRLAVATADRLRPEIAEGFVRRFGKVLVQALGIIEIGLPVMNLASAATKPGSLGRALPGFEVSLRDEDGRPVPSTGGADAVGELCVRGPGMFDAYLDPWTPAAEVMATGGFRTGDHAWADADGDLWLAGRRANRVSMAGLKFFCEEVEAVLETHPDVRAARVSPRPHAHVGEIPVAEIVAVDPLHPPTSDSLAAHCRGHLASFKVPREFSVVADLPRTPTGKLRRWRE